MTYVQQGWVDNVTPVDAAHMLHIEAGIGAAEITSNKNVNGGYLGLDANGYVPLANLGTGQIALKNDFAGAGLPALVMGTGPSGAGADTWLYRAGGGAIATSGGIFVPGPVSNSGAPVGTVAFSALVGSETNYRWQVDNQGKIWWGNGTLGVDTNLYRVAAGFLGTDGHLIVAGNAYVDNGAGGSKIYFGSAQDTTLYRLAANNLATNSLLSFRLATGTDWALASRGVGDTSDRWAMTADGYMRWGPGTAGADTFLFRAGANTLRTDGTFVVAQGIYAAYDGTNWGVVVGSPADGFTLGGDTTLYRAAAGFLRTDGSFSVGPPAGTRYVEMGLDRLGGGQAQIWFSNLLDTNLYRSAANLLKSDGGLVLGGGLYFGSANDAYLYRSAANVVRSDQTIDANALSVNGKKITVVAAYIDASGVVTGNRGVTCEKLDTGIYRVHWPNMNWPVVTVTPTTTLTMAAAQLINGSSANIYTTASVGTQADTGMHIVVVDCN